MEPLELLKRFQTSGVLSASKTSLINDLEPPAFQCAPQLAMLKHDLQKINGMHGVMMSGSGTSLLYACHA
jgi:4-diphosphocytidyl-2C-methyl-D-erythritol kinase